MLPSASSVAELLLAQHQASQHPSSHSQLQGLAHNLIDDIPLKVSIGRLVNFIAAKGNPTDINREGRVARRDLRLKLSWRLDQQRHHEHAKKGRHRDKVSHGELTEEYFPEHNLAHKRPREFHTLLSSQVGTATCSWQGPWQCPGDFFFRCFLAIILIHATLLSGGFSTSAGLSAGLSASATSTVSTISAGVSAISAICPSGWLWWNKNYSSAKMLRKSPRMPACHKWRFLTVGRNSRS